MARWDALFGSIVIGRLEAPDRATAERMAAETWGHGVKVRSVASEEVRTREERRMTDPRRDAA